MTSHSQEYKDTVYAGQQINFEDSSLDDSQDADGRREATIRPEWLTYRNAEVYSSLSRGTLWKLLNAGEIRAARVGRAVRINRESLDDYLSRQSFDEAGQGAWKT